MKYAIISSCLTGHIRKHQMRLKQEQPEMTVLLQDRVNHTHDI